MEIKMNLARGHEPSSEADMWQRYVRAERLLAANAAKLTSDLLDPSALDRRFIALLVSLEIALGRRVCAGRPSDGRKTARL